MAEKKKIPAIRFKGFSDGWEEKKLGDICDIVGGGTPSTSIPEYWNGNIDWYSPTEIGDSVFANESVKKITRLGLEKSSAKILPADKTILFTSRAGIGDVAILTKKGATNQGFQSFVLTDDIDTYFIFSAAHLIKEYALRHASGSTFLEISSKQLRGMDILIPCQSEQTQIGAYFQKLDQLIRLHQQKHEKLVSLKKAMLKKLFPQNGAKIPEIRFKGFSDPWEERTLGEMACFTKGQGYSKGDLVESGVPIILYGRLYTNYETTISNVDTFVLGKKASVKSTGNEVIVPSSGETAEDIARASAVINEGILLGGDLNIILPSNYLNSVFLALTLSNGEPKNNLSKRAQGKSVVHLRNSDLESLTLCFPALQEQQKISTYFDQLDGLIAQHAEQGLKLKQIKIACLEKMFV